MKKIIASMFALALPFGQTAFAQEASTQDATTSASVSDVQLPTQTPVIETPPTTETASSTPVQDTSNTQDTVSADTLQGASNPEDLATSTPAVQIDATTTPPIIVESTATSSPESMPVDVPPTLDVVAPDITMPDPPPLSEVQPTPPAAIAEEDLVPKPEYTFAMTGKQVATKRTVQTADGKKHEEDISTTIAPQIDNSSGTMRISGACSSAYFVVLLFKNQEDYARDPQSYILNKAFPCVNGAFSYDISDLPDSLQNGTYYLLVGAEEERGPWVPITGLTEISINRAH